MSVACSSPPLLSSSSCSTATLDAQCSLSDLNHDHPRPVEVRQGTLGVDTRGVPCRTSTTTIHAQCSLPDLNREYPRQVFPAGPQPGTFPAQRAPLDLNLGPAPAQCAAGPQRPDRMPEDMPDRMPDRMPEDMPDKMP